MRKLYSFAFLTLLPILLFTYAEIKTVNAAEPDHDLSVTWGDPWDDPEYEESQNTKYWLIGDKGGQDSTGHFPSGWGIKLEIQISNSGKDEVKLPKGTRVISFGKQEGQNLFAKYKVDVIAGQDEIIKGASGKIFTAFFDSGLLEEGLNNVDFVVDPDGLVTESDETNNTGVIKIFHPSSYPDIVITEIEIPDVEHVKGNTLKDPRKIIVRGKNIGGDMTRTVIIQAIIKQVKGLPSDLDNAYMITGLEEKTFVQLKSGESFEHIFILHGGMDGSPYIPELVEIRVQDPMMLYTYLNPFQWIHVLNFPESNPLFRCENNTDWSPDGQVGPVCSESPLERGSEHLLVGNKISQYQGNNATPKGYSGPNLAKGTLKFTIGDRYPFYPSDGKMFLLGEYPPLEKDFTSCFSCVPESETGNTAQWKVDWLDSVLRFRWLPNSSLFNYSFILEIIDAEGNVVHSNDESKNYKQKVKDGTEYFDLEPRHYSDLYDYYHDYLSYSQEDAVKAALSGIFMEYVYDGPPLTPGEYAWRIKGYSGRFKELESTGQYDSVIAEPKSEWVQGSDFTLKSNNSSSGDSPFPKLYQPQEATVTRGEVVESWPGGFTVATESGLVNMITDANSIIYSGLSGLHDYKKTDPQVPNGWIVNVLSQEIPYLQDKLVSLNEDVMFSGEITEIRPEGFTVKTEDGTVHMGTNSDTKIYNPISGYHEDVQLGWKVLVFSNELPYFSDRAYVPVNQIPIALKVDELLPTALEVTEHQMLSKHKRCTALSEADDGKVAFTCADGDYVELAASDMPFNDEIVAGSSAVILVKHTTATEDCTVIVNIPGDKSVVECPDGDRVQVDGTHEINKTLPMPVDAESFKLVSTATSLINRLQRFDLEEHQGQVTSGFTEAFEQAVANASPEVKQFMELMDDLDDKVINFAESFKTGSGQMLFDPRNIEALADQIQEFADSYGRIIGFIVVEALFELAKEKQDEIIKLIDFQSTQFISGMKDDLEKVVKLLRQANLQGAISALDEATAREQEWEELVVMPKIIGALALDSIETAQKELNEYGDSLPQNVREDLTDRLNALKQEWAKSGPETQRLMDELWAAMAAAFSSDNTDGEQGIGQDIAGKAKEMILIAESDLDQYGKFMSSAVKSGIEKAVSDLRELIEPNIDPDGKDEVQDAIDILASALNWSDESGDQDTQARANEIIAMAESELEQYGKYMTAETKEKINKLLVDLKEISKPPIDPASSSKVQTVIDELAVALTEAASPDSESSGSDEQGPDLTQPAKEALGVASDIIGTYSDSMDPGIISAIKEHSAALQAALDNGEDVSASFEALTTILKELKDQGPKPQDGFNITIECAPQIKVGREMVCSFKNDRNPDSVTWTAAGGTPASGNGSTFQTSFAAEGSYLISLKACIGSNCIEDVQEINVVAGSSGQQGSGQSSGGETKFSVSIECASQMEVGQQLGCSFRYNRTPNTIEWSADGGTPASGSDSSFQTTFGTVGQYSISLKACMGSECITDVQAIEVVATKQSSEGK